MPANQFDDALVTLPKPANPFDTIADDMVAQRTTAVKTAVERGAKENPDQQAELIRTADRLRVPLDVVKRNPDAYKGAGTLHQPDFDQVFRDSPRLAQYLTASPEFASVAHDDLPQLSAMERALAIPKDIGISLLKGAIGIPQSVVGLADLVTGGRTGKVLEDTVGFRPAEASAILSTYYSDPQRAAFLRVQQASGLVGKATAALSNPSVVGQTVLESAPLMLGGAGLARGLIGLAPSIISGVAAGAIGEGLMGAGMAAEQTRVENPNRTLTGKQAALSAASGAGTAAFSLLGGKVAKALGISDVETLLAGAVATPTASRGLARTLIYGAVSEGLLEELPQSVQEQILQNAAQDRPLDEGVAENAVLGALAGAIMGGGANLTEHYAAVRGEAAGKVITDLGAAASASKTAKRSPEAVESFVAQAVKDSPNKAVYAPVDTWTTYWQSKGEDPAAMATSLTGDPQAYQKAVALGTDLEIPIAKYAAKLAPTEHNAFFANELKLDPAEMNAREAAAHVESLRQQQQPTEPAQPSTLDQATDLMTQRMTEQGIPADTAQTYGAIWRAGIGTLASNFGIDPLALQAQYGPQGGPTITREGMEPAPTTAPIPAEAPPDGTPEGVPVEAPTPEPQAPDTILGGEPATTLAQGPLAPAFLQARDALREQLHAQMLRREEATRPALSLAAKRLEMERQAIEKGHPFVVFDQEGHRRVIPPEQWDFKPAPGETYGIETPQGFQVLEDQGGMLPDTVLYQSGPQETYAVDDGPVPEYAGEEMGDHISKIQLVPLRLIETTEEVKPEDVARMRQAMEQGDPLPPLVVDFSGSTDAGEDTVYVVDGHTRLAAARELGYDTVPVRVRVAAEDWSRVKRAGGMAVNGGTLYQEQRGEIRFGADRQFNITLLERADLSTFLHETGHFFLEVFGDLTDQLAQREGALTPEQQRLQTDHAALLTWLGVESRAQIGREQHEQFARGFEAYLMEGKAPSLELRSAFARARAWLLGIYKSLRNLNVTLTPEVRGIFDRLLASDAAIKEAQQTASVSGMFLTAESAGWTDEQFASYGGTIEDASRKATEELDRQILAEVQREQTATWKAQREAIKAQVTTEVQQQPVYRALAAMQKGTHPNGDALIEGEETDPLKLSKTIISERYGAERLKALPKPYIYSREGGLDPDSVAEMFGFSSGDALLTAVSTAPSMRSVIERETAGRMFQQHGSLLLDGTLGEKAQAAVANDSREEVIRKELKALHTLQRKGAATLRATVPSMTAIRQAAREEIARTRYGDIKPQVYWAAGLRAGRQAVELAARQQFPEAVTAKQQQLFNLALYREAINQREESDRRVAFAKDLDSPKSRARIGLAGGTFQDQIDGILDQYDFARISQKTLNQRADLRKWIAALEGEGFSVDLPADVIEETRRINYRELTVEQLIGVTDALKQIVHLARQRRGFLKDEAKREYGVVRDGLAGSIYEHGTVRPRQLEIGQREQAYRSVSDWYASHVKLADMAQSMDGGQEGGPMWEAFVRPANDAANAEETRSREAGKTYAALLEQYYPGRELGRLSEKRHIPAINGSLSKEAILALAQNQGTDSNKARLLTDSYRKFTQPQINAILDTLDKRDWDFVQAHFDYLETYWSEIAAKMQRVTGVEPEKVPATPIVTKFGTYRGGYHPLVADTRLSPQAAQHDLATQAKLGESAAYLRATTRRGHEQARVEHADYPVRLELGVTFKHLSQVIHDLTHHEMLIDTTRLLRDPKVRQAIVETQGDIVYSKFSRWLQDIALGDTSGGGKPTIADKAATFMRTRTQIMAMAYNVWTAMQQPLGIFNGMSRVGGTDGASSGVYWVSKGMSRWLRDAGSMENTVSWIRDVSPMMAGRFGNETGTQDLRDLRTSFSQSGGWFDSLLRTVTLDHVTQQALMNSFLWHIGMAQRVADVPTWLGMYEKQMAKGETEDRAIALADQAVIDSQGGGQVKDLAEIQRGGPVAKLFMSFASYGVTVLNANARAARQTNFRSASSALSFLGHVTLLNVMPALGVVAMRRALFGGGGDDDDKGWLEAVGAEMLSSALNGIIFIRELSGAAQLALGLDTTGGRGYGGPAGMRAMKLSYDLATQIHQGEADAAAGKAALGVTGFLLKFPSTQIQKTVDGWVALEEGRTANPVALVVGPPPKGQ